MTSKKGHPLWLITPAICLLELAPPDPKRGDYRLTVELAQTDGEAVSMVGLYAGRKELRGNQDSGQTVIQAAFCEPKIENLAVKPPADPLLALATLYLKESHEEAAQLFRAPRSARTPFPPGRNSTTARRIARLC